MSNNDSNNNRDNVPTTRTRTTYTAASLPPLPVISQEIIQSWQKINQRIWKIENKITAMENEIQAGQEVTASANPLPVEFLQAEITGATAELWWWLNLQNEVVTRAGLDKLLGALKDGRLSNSEFLLKCSKLFASLSEGTATLR